MSRGPRRRTRAATLALACCSIALLVLALAGCGGGTRQDAAEARATFPMELVHASFPAQQSVARPATLRLQVKNTGERTVSTVAVTIDSFLYTSHVPELAANKRPVWVIELGPGAIAEPPVQSVEVSKPGSATTAYVNTWALGPLAPGATEIFAWHVVPVKAGSYTVHYAVAAGLSGNARVRLARGGPLQGHFDVQIAGAPPKVHVNPNSGRLVPGPYPSSP